MVLPEGFALPPLLYLIPVLVVLVGTGILLWTLRPTVTDWVVVAIIPWMVAGAAGHTMYVVDAIPPGIEPLFGVPAVYLTMGALAGVVWLVAEVTSSTTTYHDPSLYLFLAGLFCAIFAIIGVISWGVSEQELMLTWPLVGLVLAVIVTAVGWWSLTVSFPETATLSSLTGVVVIFGHVLDGISTAIGMDILDGAERSPVADAVIWIGSQLPTSGLIGDAWVFVIVKLVLPIAVLVLFREYLDEAPSQARILLAIIAAVGLGPGVYNLLLFMVSM